MSPSRDQWNLHPRLVADTHPVDRWTLCDVRLMDDGQFPWLILVPRVAGAEEVIDLSEPERHRLTDEIARASRALRDAFAPDKLNVAALGNVVPQLHVHVIARFRDDAAWPKPVWGQAEARPYPPDALAERMRVLQAAIDA